MFTYFFTCFRSFSEVISHDQPKRFTLVQGVRCFSTCQTHSLLVKRLPLERDRNHDKTMKSVVEAGGIFASNIDATVTVIFEGIFHFQILAVAQVQRSQHLHSTCTGSKSSEFECLEGLGAGCMPAVATPNMSALSAYFYLLHSTSPFPEMSINKPVFLVFDEYWHIGSDHFLGPWYFREHFHCKNDGEMLCLSQKFAHWTCQCPPRQGADTWSHEPAKQVVAASS